MVAEDGIEPPTRGFSILWMKLFKDWLLSTIQRKSLKLVDYTVHACPLEYVCIFAKKGT